MTLETLRDRWPSRTIEVAGQPFEVVRTAGDGPPVVWLPGAQGTAGSFFKQLLAWGGRRAMAAVSYPPLTDGGAIADAVVALADALDWPRFDLVGTSLGGYVAQQVAARHGTRVIRLVIGNAFTDPTPAQSAEKRHALETRSPDTVRAEALARLEAQPDGELRRVLLDLVGRRQSAELLHARMLAVQLATVVPPLAVPDERVLLIECDNDPLIPEGMRAAVRAAHPGSRCVVIEGGGHYPYITRADAYNAAVADFLEMR